MAEVNDPAMARLAVIGMAGRFPGSSDVEAFWRDLRDGVERITRFSEAELRAAGVADELLRDPSYVPAKGVLDGADCFDVAPFGMNAREAELTDPQHRIFLECALAALEDAGYAGPARGDRLIGVFAGSGSNEYGRTFTAGYARTASDYLHTIASEKDFLATRVSYKLDLRGPSLTVQSACSTSLAAVCVASQSLLAYQCDVAIAGGVSISLPLRAGYLHQPGMVLSKDGRCRPFDADASGTVPGDGAAVVVLRRLEDAIADGDEVLAVLCGFGLRNDGAAKQSFSAPGIDGQAGAILDALAMAGISPETLSYIEAHGTGTPLGDPIEVAALLRAFRGRGRRQGCAIGSVKSNIGHLDAAAGVVGLIKVVQMLRHRAIPKTLHLERENPQLRLATTPFFVSTALRPWEPNGPRRAGVSSFGIGGTNAHVILEEAPSREPSLESERPQLLTLSAATTGALEAAETRLARFLAEHPEAPFADVAFTLHVGRRAYRSRRSVVCADRAAAIVALTNQSESDRTEDAGDTTPEVVFLFPGHGAGYPGMGRELYATWPSFRADIDEGLTLLRDRANLDLRPTLFPTRGAHEDAGPALAHAALGQPATFLVAWAVGRLLLSWGVRPSMLLGHSLGEYAAACLAGVMSLEDGLLLVAKRGALIAGTPKGAMLSVGLSPEDLRPWLGDELSLAVINGPALCVVAGREAAVLALERKLATGNIVTRRLPVPHAFHSHLMDAIVEPLVASTRRLTLQHPKINLISCVTGHPLGADQATDPQYWGTHLCETVRFDAALRRACEGADRILVEVGPGDALTTLARRLPGLSVRRAVSTLGRASEQPQDTARLLNAAGTLWTHDAPIDLERLHTGERRQRVRLPSYPFEPRRYWLETPRPSTSGPMPRAPSDQRDIGGWFYRPSWRPAPLAEPLKNHTYPVLIFADTKGLAAHVMAELGDARGTLVLPGDQFARTGSRAFALRPADPGDYAALIELLASTGELPDHVLHLWSVDAGGDASIERGLLSVTCLLRALGSAYAGRPVRLQVVTCDSQPAGDAAVERPEQAMAHALLRVVPEEYPHIRCCTIDLSSSDLEEKSLERLARSLLDDLALAEGPVAIAYRSGQRYELEYLREPMDTKPSRPALREGGTCLITGGLGGIGLVLARHLAKAARARLALVSRTGLPPRELWGDILAADPAPEPDSIAYCIRRVVDLEREGTAVLVLAADVTREAELRRTIAEIHAHFGPIHGVIHAAGVMVGGVIQRGIEVDLDAALAPKLRGTRLLASLTAGEPLDFFGICSSLTAIAGGFGQLAYAAANCFQDAFAGHLCRRGVRAVSINWDGWAEVGAAARASRTTASEAVRRSADVHPLVGKPVLRTAAFSLFQGRLDPAVDWLLREHRIHGRPTLPGTAYIELSRAVAAELLGDRPLVLRDMVLFSPIAADEGDVIEVWTLARAIPEGIAIEVRSRRAGTEGPVATHAQCTASVLNEREPAPIDLRRMHDDCVDEGSVEELLETRRHVIDLGEPWRCMTRLRVSHTQATAELVVPERSGHALHPAVLDMGAGCAAHLASLDHLPHAYREIRIYGPLQGRVVSHATLVERTERSSRFAVALYDERGTARVAIDDYLLLAAKTPSTTSNQK